MRTIHLQPQEYSTLAVDLEPEGAEVAGYGLAADAFFLFSLTDTERLLLAAALLREGETVMGSSDACATLERTKGG